MKKDSKSLLWGIIAGSVLGSVTALLLAPKPGKELRKDIADGTSATIDKAQDIAVQVGDKGTELYGKAKDAVGNVVHEVREWGKQYTGTDEEETLAVSEIAVGEAAGVVDAAEEAAVTVEASGEADVIVETESGAADLEAGAEASIEPAGQSDTGKSENV